MVWEAEVGHVRLRTKPLNLHFYLPQTVSIYYQGHHETRKLERAMVVFALINSIIALQQKCFVVLASSHLKGS